MIGYLRGRILDVSDDGKFLVGVGSAESSVGYLVSIPQGIEYEVYSVGREVEVFIYTHIREDQFDLYGFLTQGEKAVFMSLLNVSGIGPKSALTILSKVGAPLLIQSILQGNSQLLQEIPGIGKKTSEKIVVELKDSIKKKIESGQWAAFHIFGQPSSGQEKSKKDSLSHSDAEVSISGKMPGLTQSFQDAKEALVSLGYREQEIYTLLHRILSDSTSSSFQKAEDLVRTALKELR